MPVLNRKIAPKIEFIKNISFENFTENVLKNNLPVYYINSTEEDIIKIDFVFNAGKWYSDSELIASLTNKMLIEGSKKYSSSKIADIFDFYGAYTEQNTGNDFSAITLYCLNKHLDKVLPVMSDIIENPIFPENEFETLVQNTKQNYVVNNEKVNFLARKHFPELIFGSNHPYGKSSDLKEFDTIDISKISSFYNKNYLTDKMKIFVSGKVDKKTIKVVEKYFGDLAIKSIKEPICKSKINDDFVNKTNYIEKKNVVQSAIRIGRKIPNRGSADYMKIKIYNVILGGYFGSRLMENIREDKGYTYGIGSGVVSYKNDAMFFISTELKAEVTKDAINEIYKEIDRLKQEFVSEEELNLVKNYMLGSILRNADGPFAMADLKKELILNNLPNDYYENYIESIKNINSKDIQLIANKYFNTNNLAELVVGKK